MNHTRANFPADRSSAWPSRALSSPIPPSCLRRATGDLDRKSADEIMELIHRLVKEFGKTVLMVTHDPVSPNAPTSRSISKKACWLSPER